MFIKPSIVWEIGMTSLTHSSILCRAEASKSVLKNLKTIPKNALTTDNADNPSPFKNKD